MDALESFFRPVARLLNRNIRASTPAKRLCERLAGRVVAVRVAQSSLAMYFTIGRDGVELASDMDEEPDVVISGSLLTLARMTTGGGEDAVRDGSIELTGDAETARDFQKLLAFARPDLEEELSALVGDTAAHGVGELLRNLGEWGRRTRSTMRDNLREYLQEESRDVPSRDEIARFADAVYQLRDDIERLAARVRRLAGDS